MIDETGGRLYPDEWKVEDWRVGADHRARAVSRDELVELGDAPLGEGETLVFTWNDLRDPVVIAVVGDEWSVVTLMLDAEWYSAVRLDGVGSDDERKVLVIGEDESSWRTSEVLPREAASEVLRALPDLERVRREFRWLSQWRQHAEDQAPDINL